MENWSEKIVDYLVRNRVSTTEVADALGKTGVLPGVFPINKGMYKAGVVKWIYAYGESNWPVHEQIQNIDEDRIILVDAFDCNGRAVFGELVSKYLLLYRQSRALVILGNMRDAAALLRNNWPIWCEGYNPVGCFNRKPNFEFDLSEERLCREKYEGSIAVCDDCGVVIIPKDKLNEEFLGKLIQIEEQEDIWFDRLDYYKENTFQIVCKKEYLSDDKYMKYRKREQ